MHTSKHSINILQLGKWRNEILKSENISYLNYLHICIKQFQLIIWIKLSLTWSLLRLAHSSWKITYSVIFKINQYIFTLKWNRENKIWVGNMLKNIERQKNYQYARNLSRSTYEKWFKKDVILNSLGAFVNAIVGFQKVFRSHVSCVWNHPPCTWNWILC